MNAGQWMKSPLMAVLGLGTVFAGVLVAATGQTITTPNGNDGIQPDFAFRAGIPFASLKEVATWHEAEQLLDNPYALGSCPADGRNFGNTQGYPARCATIQRRRSYLPAGCTYDPTTGLPPCNDALLPPLLCTLNYNPVTGEQIQACLIRLSRAGAFLQSLSGADIGPISAGSTASSQAMPLRSITTARSSPIRNPTATPANPPATPARRYVGTIRRPVGRNAPGLHGQHGQADRSDDRRGHWPAARHHYVACANRPRRQPTRQLRCGAGQPAAGAQAVKSRRLLPDRRWQVVLGKALFWDMQLGSDGVQACATCHFTAGADTHPQLDNLNPGTWAATAPAVFRNRHLDTPNRRIPTRTPIRTSRTAIFRRIALRNRRSRRAAVQPVQHLSDTNDIVGSMGIRFASSPTSRQPGRRVCAGQRRHQRGAAGQSAAITDQIPIYRSDTARGAAQHPDGDQLGIQLRQFLGRTREPRLQRRQRVRRFRSAGHVFVDSGGTLQKTRQLIRFATSHSQMTGPALSDFEMSFQGRSWPVIAKKLLQGDGIRLAART